MFDIAIEAEGRIVDASVYAYLILLVVFRWTENILMMRTGTFKIRFKMQWTTWVLTALFVIIALSPIVEHMHLRTEPGYVSWTLGAIAFVAATMFRAKGHLDLKKGFSPYIERTDGQELVDTGLYKHIRHPLYIGTLLMFVACPLFLASRVSWVFTALGFAGTIVRIKVEERFLLDNMDGYKAYMGRTWALIPWIY